MCSVPGTALETVDTAVRKDPKSPCTRRVGLPVRAEGRRQVVPSGACVVTVCQGGRTGHVWENFLEGLLQLEGIAVGCLVLMGPAVPGKYQSP